MFKIDELSRRKPNWSEGYPATLADGQTWFFPRIRLRLKPVRDETGRFHARDAFTANGVELADYDRWYGVVTGAIPVKGRDYLGPRISSAAELLALNYDLTDPEVGELLAWDEEDEPGACAERWDEIDLGIKGAVPKRLPVTCDLPVSSEG